MKCPVCDTENAPGLTVCDMCGSELPEGKECKGCGAIIPKNVAYCPHCKALADVKPASSSTNSGMPMYFVALDDVGDDRQEVIKVIQALRNCGFEEAREIIDGDGIVLNEVPKLEAEIAVSKLRGAGAEAGMEEIDYELDAILSDNSNRGSSSSSSRSSSSSSANNEGGFVNSPTYGILAIVFCVLGGWIGLILSLYGLFKSSNEGVKKNCKIGLIILGVVVVLSIVLGIIVGVAGAGVAGGYDY